MSNGKMRQTRITLAWLFLLTVLWTRVGGAQGLAVLWAMTDNSHKTRLTLSHGTIHVIFHHSANPNEHNLPAGDRGKYGHDLLGSLLTTVSTAVQDRHPDHVIHLIDQGQHVIVTKKTTRAFKTFFSGLTTPPRIAFIEPASMGLFPHPPPKVNPTLVCLRTIVLLT